MATLVLGIAGSLAGGAALSGLSFLGIGGAQIGGAVGALTGAIVDQKLIGPLLAPTGQGLPQGPRLGDVKLGSSTEGTSLPRAYGQIRLPGLLIWATRFNETQTVVTQPTGGGQEAGDGKGGLGDAISSGQSGTVKTVQYNYFANVAYAVCEGPITRIGRIWADGKELNQSKYTIRVHRGTEDQSADALIVGKEGADNAPAYRGTAYVVFANMPLASFGNRLPQLNFEVFRAVDDFESRVKAVNLIPAAGEFIYDTTAVVRTVDGVSQSENLHTTLGGTDISVSLDQLADQLPNIANVALVATWFGTDLRIGHCQLKPGVETTDKTTLPYDWSVNGVSRGDAYLVSSSEGRPAYGGTPADRSIVTAIRELKTRGLGVTFYPFISMDVAADNSLPNPYGGIGQPAYPWRGRISCDPAPGETGSVDKTSACATQIAAFVGSAAVSDFHVSGTEVSYSGPDEWSFRRFILHYAKLCAAAGGVDAFIIGSELRGATTLRSGASTFPFVTALADLAADVKSVLGDAAKLTYGADWSEHVAYAPQDGLGDVFFHLDPLWASDAIDAVGIDAYWPLADWRDGDSHLDYLAGFRSIYDLNYLRGNVRGGEGFDFFYPAGEDGEPSADRIAQTRSAIGDGAYGKPWVFRPKAILEWWQNQHFDRPAGVESGSATVWVPQSKPVWFTELGCPAIDKGANQPNVFIDPKSSESVAPYFSRGLRDDLMQRRYIEAFASFYDPADPAYGGANPVSTVYGGTMVDLARLYIYTWDARPYPAFPLALSVWGDGGNWELGHWLTGRVAGGSLAAVVAQVLEDYGFAAYDASGLNGIVQGFVIDRIMAARDALQPLGLAYFFDAYESGGLIHFVQRGQIGSVATVTPDHLVETDAADPLYSITRGQETELPLSAKVTYIGLSNKYRQKAVEARRLNVRSDRVSAADLPIVMDAPQAQAIADSMLQDAWAAREKASFSLPPSLLALEPSDMITLDASGRSFRLRITDTRDADAKAIDALSIEPRVYDAIIAPLETEAPELPSVYGPTAPYFLDLPLIRGDEPPQAGYVTAFANPWPGSIAVYRSPTTSGYQLNTLLAATPTLGKTGTDFYSGPLWRYDRSNTLRVALDAGELDSATEDALLSGAHYLAIQNADGGWELIQFQNAELVGTLTYDLSMLLRGQAGTESAMRDPVAAGARVILIDSALVQLNMTAADIGLPLNYEIGPASEAIGDLSYAAATYTFTGIGYRPLAPVHLEGIREIDSGDWTLTWIRRTRIGGDSWDTEVPVGEDSELYQLDVLDGDTSVRTVTGLGTSAYRYHAADQVTDFGAVQPSITIRVSQVSGVYGPGEPATREIFEYRR